MEDRQRYHPLPALGRRATHEAVGALNDIMILNMNGLLLFMRTPSDLATSHIRFQILTNAETRLRSPKLAVCKLVVKPFGNEYLSMRFANTARVSERRQQNIMASDGKERDISLNAEAFITQVNAGLQNHYGASTTRINDLAQYWKLDDRDLQRNILALFRKPRKTMLDEHRLDRSAKSMKDQIAWSPALPLSAAFLPLPISAASSRSTSENGRGAGKRRKPKKS